MRELVLAALAASLAWLLALCAFVVRRRPEKPTVGPATLELGPEPEPPAIVNFLAHGFRVTADAVPATLLDLAARGVVTLEHRGPDAFVCRLGAIPANLTRYEQRVVSLLQARLSGGSVPPEALTVGPEAEARRWRRAFDADVVADAQRRGLCRPIADGALVVRMLVAALLPAILWGVLTRHSRAADGFAFIVGAACVLIAITSRRTQRDTPAGLASATHWLGLREALHEDEVFPTLPPITVGMWKRYLAYGAALGVAPGAVRPIPIGAESVTRAWSSYGGRWRAVRVEYPLVLPIGWGLHPLLALAIGTAIGMVSGIFLYVVAGPLASGLSSLSLAAPILVPPALGALGSLVLVGRAVADMPSTPFTLRGEILRLRVLGEKNKRWFAAVDDGSGPRVRALVVRPAVYARLEQGEVVQALVTRHLRYVRDIAPAENGR